MKRVFILILLCAGTAFAQTPVCGLNNNENVYIPGYTTSGGSNTYDSGFSVPAIGSSYVDALTGCTVVRITNNSTAAAGWTVYYSSITPFDASDKYMLLTNTANGAWEIVTGPALTGTTPGTVVIASYPANNYHPTWDSKIAGTSYYATGLTLKKAVLTGACTSTSNCSLTITTLHDYSTGAKVYAAIGIQDEPDMAQDGTVFLFDGQVSLNGAVDIDTYNPSNDTTTVWYTTTCTAGLGGQPSCSNVSGNAIHKIQLSANDEPLITWELTGTSAERGLIWYHGTPGTATQTHIQTTATSHIDSGFDLNGTQIYVQDRLDSGFGTDPCPSGQWSPSLTPTAAATVTTTAAGGGADLVYYTDPTNSMSTAVCFFNKNWGQPHFSYRGGPSQPWVTVSFFDQRNPGPEWFNTSGSYTTLSTTFVGGSAPPANSYTNYESEIDLVKINTNMNSASLTPLSSVYRMAQARARSNQNFWVEVTASNSHDSNYIAFNSNMAWPAGNCSATNLSANGCGDVYVISGPSGSGLLRSPATPTPAAPVKAGLLIAKGQ